MLVMLLPGGPAWAQALPTGDGLKADYYNGSNFEEFVLSQRDATVDFDWAFKPPVPGAKYQYFSVRWTGWLVPPASGRYVFHITVDDGMRIWLNDRLILNEWRLQPLSYFTTAVELKGGEPYRLWVEYFQDILDTRASITWELPNASPPPSSWHNLWGLTDSKPKPAPIPKRYLFSHNPRPPAPQPVQLTLPPEPPAVARAQPQTPPAPAARPIRVKPRRPAAQLAPAPQLRVVAPMPTPAVRAVPDSSRTAQLARLSVGESVTLPELYFNQGQARLLSAARTALDGLASVLSSRPDLYLEVQGHTDNVGNAELNRQLSQQRAEAVCRYLMAHGVAAGQLRPVGYGGTQPVADNADPAQRPRNRRVVLRRL
ncbi:hypothetical protein AUC43_06830 [Hymenobacter sedentarius]|uniref:PA14 domain-containing protein n=1 Tax=Hymenobacter sedentarius TaxID=1411621 RepID=A0A0U4BM55_9BACT|nr:hypothetical protein AUC43_06830 [Hymenobacter sedentarius]